MNGVESIKDRDDFFRSDVDVGYILFHLHLNLGHNISMLSRLH